jgi:hypothetical protein
MLSYQSAHCELRDGTVASGNIQWHSIDIEDLQEFEILRNRKRVSPGELSDYFCTENPAGSAYRRYWRSKARAPGTRRSDGAKYASSLAWLYFNSNMCDLDKDQIVTDLKPFGRSLQPHLDEYHAEAPRCRALANQAK